MGLNFLIGLKVKFIIIFCNASSDNMHFRSISSDWVIWYAEFLATFTVISIVLCYIKLNNLCNYPKTGCQTSLTLRQFSLNFINTWLITWSICKITAFSFLVFQSKNVNPRYVIWLFGPYNTVSCHDETLYRKVTAKCDMVSPQILNTKTCVKTPCGWCEREILFLQTKSFHSHFKGQMSQKQPPIIFHWDLSFRHKTCVKRRAAGANVKYYFFTRYILTQLLLILG